MTLTPRETEVVHGATAYRKRGCRCDICRAAHSAKCREWFASAPAPVIADRQENDRVRKHLERHPLPFAERPSVLGTTGFYADGLRYPNFTFELASTLRFARGRA